MKSVLSNAMTAKTEEAIKESVANKFSGDVAKNIIIAKFVGEGAERLTEHSEEALCELSSVFQKKDLEKTFKEMAEYVNEEGEDADKYWVEIFVRKV